jgi:hypothetical protein
VPARKFKTTQVDPYDEHDNNQLSARYSVAAPAGARPSFVPHVTEFLATHGRAEDAMAQRRGSVGVEMRRPSIAPAVSEFLRKEGV